jgi:LacI family transcriptional regulator
MRPATPDASEVLEIWQAEPELDSELFMPKSANSRVPKVILLIESSRASGRALLRGIASYAHHHGPWSFVWEPGGLEKAWPTLKSMDADGIILRDTEKTNEALAIGMPAVVVGHIHSEIPDMINVLADSDTVGRLGAEHLIQCGFKHFAYCGHAKFSMERTEWSVVRQGAFAKHIRRAGFQDPAVYTLSTAKDGMGQRRSLVHWLQSLPKPVGLMACNDDCGQIVMDACKLAGLCVPDTVGVVGADNDEVVCGLTDPPMSSVDINFERAGYEAAQALESLMRHGRVAQKRILAAAAHVVPRRSTDVVAINEPHLVKALQYIRDHARSAVSVDDVTSATALSRRGLEKRFRRILGRSILEEIRRVRTDQIARLLVETDLPVSAIADLLGFPQVQHVARYFRATKGLSPGRYRQMYGRQNYRGGGSQNGVSFSQTGVAFNA